MKPVKNCNEVYETEHLLKMWMPLSFRVTEKYKYFPQGVIFNFMNRLLRMAVYIVFPIYNRIFLGVKVKGRKNLRKLRSAGAVTVCNHVNVLDSVLVACHSNRRKICYPTLTSNFRIPVVRRLIRWLGAVPIPEDKQNFKRMKLALEQNLKKGGIVHFFPETVMHPYYEGMRGFRRGAFLLAYNCNVPVLPYVITYRRPRGLYRLYKSKPCLTLHILEPVYPDTAENRRDETERLKNTVYQNMRNCFNPRQSLESPDNQN